MSQSYYITTPIYYVNDKPHIGHAYTTIACDVIARFKRLDGYNVKFLTGTDEHGQKVEQSAAKAGADTKLFVDRVSKNFQDLMPKLNITHSRFIRTTDSDHALSVQHLWQKLVQQGDIYLGSYAGWYSVRDEAFYAEAELVDGKAPTGAEVEWVEEPSYFFRLSKWQDRLLTFYEKNPDFILPKARRNEVLRFVEGGLLDLSVSRTTFKWGVPVPGDPDHIMYVWIDALTNYLTGVGYPNVTSDDFRTFWPADVHIVGKDILRFHAVYWPAFLLAAGINPPKRIFAHGWWTNEGQKISKSLGNVIDPVELVDEFGLDPVRYFLMKEVSFGQDGDFSVDALKQRNNADLANSYGNLVQRVLSFIYKNCDQKIPAPNEFHPEDLDLMKKATDMLSKSRTFIDDQAIHKFCECIWEVIYAANAYVDKLAPWSLRKTDVDRMNTVLYVLVDVIRKLATITQPLMPEASEKILNQLNITEKSFKSFETETLYNTPIEQPQGVFPRVED